MRVDVGIDIEGILSSKRTRMNLDCMNLHLPI